MDNYVEPVYEILSQRCKSERRYINTKLITTSFDNAFLVFSTCLSSFKYITPPLNLLLKGENYTEILSMNNNHML